MQQLKVEAESIQISIYCDVILDILCKHKKNKCEQDACFCILNQKKDRFIPNNIYNGNTTQDVIYKCISLLAGDYVEFCNNIEFIIKAIHLLKTNGLIFFENELLHMSHEVSKSKTIFEQSKFMQNAIESSKRMTDRQFLKEVTSNV